MRGRLGALRLVQLILVASVLPACGGSGGGSVGPAPIPDFHDPSFNPGGIVRVQGAQDATAAALAIQPDGKVVVAGTATGPGGLVIVVARFTADGVPDSLFNAGGIVITPVPGGDALAGGVAIQSDGRIVVGGTSAQGFAAVRYMPDGSLDSAFNGGIAEMAVAGTESVTSVAIQSDGKIVVAGTSNNDFAAVRFNSDGTPDLTFDGDGKVVTTVGSGNDFCYAMVLQPDGKIVLAGIAHNGTDNDFALVRYNSNGSLDTTFDGDGKVVTPIGSASDVAVSLALAPGGKLVAAGSSNGGANVDVAVVRYNSDGSLDAGFGGTGKVTTPVGAAADFANAVAVLPDGRILAAGGTQNGPKQDLALLRYLSGGTTDPAFGTAGKVTTAGGINSLAANAVGLQGSKIVVAATATGSGGSGIAVLRYDVGGTLDPSFRNVGVITESFGSNGNDAHALAIQPDGKILVGASTVSYPAGDFDFALLRYNADGSPDVTFGTAGRAITPNAGVDDILTAVAVQPDGKILACGYMSGTLTIRVARYTTVGGLDATFGTSGIRTLSSGTGCFPYAMALQPDGKILLAGAVDSPLRQFLTVRLLTDGSTDPSFGLVTTTLSPGSNTARAICVQPDGKIVVAGLTTDAVQFNAGIVRYTSTGALDATFGSGGTILRPLGPIADVYGLVLRPDGRIAAGCMSAQPAPAQTDSLLLQFNTDGTPDPSFGSAGESRLAFPPSSYMGAMFLQPDGKILQSAKHFDLGVSLYRYQTNGSLDLSFGVGGWMPAPYVAGRYEFPYAVALQADGKIVSVGNSNSGVNTEIGVARFVP